MAPDDDEDVVEVVASVGALDEVVGRCCATTCTGRARCGRWRLSTARPGEGPAVVDCGRLAPVEVDLGDRRVYLPHAIELDVAPPRAAGPFDELRRGSRWTRRRARSRAAIGGLEHVVEGVRGARRGAGRPQRGPGAQFETTDPDAPLTVTARAEPGASR